MLEREKAPQPIQSPFPKFIDRALTRLGLPEDPQLRCLVAFAGLMPFVFVTGTAAVLAAGRAS